MTDWLAEAYSYQEDPAYEPIADKEISTETARSLIDEWFGYGPVYSSSDYYDDYHDNVASAHQNQVSNFNKLVANAPSADTAAAKKAAEALNKLISDATSKSQAVVSDAVSNIKTLEVPTYAPYQSSISSILNSLSARSPVDPDTISILASARRQYRESGYDSLPSRYKDVIDEWGAYPDIQSALDSISAGTQSIIDNVLTTSEFNYSKLPDVVAGLSDYVSRLDQMKSKVNDQLKNISSDTRLLADTQISNLRDILPGIADQYYYSGKDLISNALDVTKNALDDVINSSESTVSSYSDQWLDKIRSAQSPDEVSELLESGTAGIQHVVDVNRLSSDALKDNYKSFANNINTQFGNLVGNLTDISIASDYAKKDVDDTLDEVNYNLQSIIDGFVDDSKSIAGKLAEDSTAAAVKPDIGSVLRDYYSQAAPVLNNLAESSDEDTKNELRNSLQFKNIVVASGGQGLDDYEVADIITDMGKHVYGNVETAMADKAKGVDISDAYVYAPVVGWSHITSEGNALPIKTEIANVLADQFGDLGLDTLQEGSNQLLEVQSIVYQGGAGAYGPLPGTRQILGSAYEYDPSAKQFVLPDRGNLLSETPVADLQANFNRLQNFANNNTLQSHGYDIDNFNCDDFTRAFIKQASTSVDPITREPKFSSDDLRYGYISFDDGSSHAAVLYKIGDREYENGTEPVYAMYEPQTDTWVDLDTIGQTLDYIIVTKDVVTDDISSVEFVEPESVYLGPGATYTADEFTSGVVVSPTTVAQSVSHKIGYDIDKQDTVNRADLDPIIGVTGAVALDLLANQSDSISVTSDEITIGKMSLVELYQLNQILEGNPEQAIESILASPRIEEPTASVQFEWSDVPIIGSSIQKISDIASGNIGGEDQSKDIEPGAGEGTRSESVAPALTSEGVAAIQAGEASKPPTHSTTDSSSKLKDMGLSPSDIDAQGQPKEGTPTETALLSAESDLAKFGPDRISPNDKWLLSTYRPGALTAARDTGGITVTDGKRIVSTDSPIFADVKLAHDTPESQRTSSQTKLVEAYALPEQLPTPRDYTGILDRDAARQLATSLAPWTKYSYTGVLDRDAIRQLATSRLTEDEQQQTAAAEEPGTYAQAIEMVEDIVLKNTQTKLDEAGLYVDEHGIKLRIPAMDKMMEFSEKGTDAILRGGGSIEYNGVQFSAPEVVDIVLKHGNPYDIRRLQADTDASKRLTIDAPDEFANAKLRASNAYDVTKQATVVNNLNTEQWVVLPDAIIEATGYVPETMADGTPLVTAEKYFELRRESGYDGPTLRQTVPVGMDPNTYFEYKHDGSIWGTLNNGTLALTSDGESMKDDMYNRLVTAIDRTPVGESVSVPKLSDDEMQLLAFGMSNSEVDYLTRSVESEYDGQPVVLQSLADRINNDTLYDAISEKQSLRMISSNSDLMRAISEQREWRSNGWIDDDGNPTVLGKQVVDDVFESSILGESTADSSARSFSLGYATDEQLSALNKSASFNRLDPSEQRYVTAMTGEHNVPLSERLSRIFSVGSGLVADFTITPSSDDPKVNAALLVAGILPIGKIGTVSKGALGTILKSDDGVKFIAKAFKNADNVDEQAKALRAAENKLSPSDYKRLVSGLKEELGTKYDDVYARSLELSKGTMITSSAWANSATYNEMRLAAATPDGMASLAGMSDRAFDVYKKSIADPDKISFLEIARNDAIQRASAFAKDPELQTAADVSMLADWASYQEKLATKSPGAIELLKKKTGLGADIDAARSLGEMRLAYKTNNGVSVAEAVAGKNVRDITAKEAAMLSDSEFAKIATGKPTRDAATLLDKRSAGLVDIIASSGKTLAPDQNAIITKLATGKDLTTKEAAELGKIAESVGSSPVRNLLTNWADARLIKTAGKAGLVYVGAVSFGLFMLEEQAQNAGQFSLMSADYDPLQFGESLRKGIGSYEVGQLFTDRSVVKVLAESSLFNAIAPQIGPTYDYVTETFPNYLEDQRSKGVTYGSWIPEGDFTFEYRGQTMTVKGWGRPATEEEYLQALRDDPAKLNYLEGPAFQKYLSKLNYSDENVAQLMASGVVIGHYNDVSDNVKSILDESVPAPVKTGEMTMAQYVSSGGDLTNHWNGSEKVYAEFKKADGSWDVAKLSSAIADHRLRLYDLYTYTPDAAKAIATTTNLPADTKDPLEASRALNKSREMLFSDKNALTVVKPALTNYRWQSLVMQGKVPGNLASVVDVDYKWSGIPDGAPVLVGLPDSTYSQIVLFDERVDDKGNRVLSTDEKRWWLDNIGAPETIDENGWSYLFATDVISSEELGKQIGYDKRDIVMQDIKVGGKDVMASTYLALAKDETPVPSIVSFETVTRLPSFLRSSPVGTAPAEFKHLVSLDDGTFTLAELSANPEFWQELSNYYNADPTAAETWLLSKLQGNSESIYTEANYINMIKDSGLRDSILGHMDDPSNYDGKAEGGRYKWTDETGGVHSVDLFDTDSVYKGSYQTNKLYDPEEGRQLTKEELAAKYGIKGEFMLDPDAWANYLNGKGPLEAAFVYASTEAVKSFGGGGGGGGGGGWYGGGYSGARYSTGSIGLYVDCNVTADIIYQGKILGKSGELIPFPSGEYEVTISATGYRSKTQIVTILSTKTTNLSVTLYKTKYTVCDMVDSIGGSFAVTKAHFVYVYCKYRNWAEAAAALLDHMTKPPMEPDSYSRSDVEYIYDLAAGDYSGAQALIDIGTVCGVS